MIKSEKGVTLSVLVVTIIVLAIITGVTIVLSVKTINSAKAETIRTNMLFLQAKGKEYVENANFKLGMNQDELTEEQKETIKKDELHAKKCTEIPEHLVLKEGEEAYKLLDGELEKMGLKDIKDTADYYIMIYDIKNEKADVMYTLGVEYNDKLIYRLSEIEGNK